MTKQFKMQAGKIGSLKCEQSLERVLISLANHWIAHKALNRYDEAKSGYNRIIAWMQASLSSTMIRTALMLWKDEQLKRWEKTVFDSQEKQSPISKDVDTHLRCCIMARYKLAIKEVKEFETSVGKEQQLKQAERGNKRLNSSVG